ncbi:hypothetical protein BCV69DRAFT_290858, partial [Microstroma glucosiphilum]
MTHWYSKRHLTGGNPKSRSTLDLPDWRMRERLRTVTAALVMCLNIGVDPPDVSKTNPCSKLICWMDPSSLEVSKALPAIGKNLQAQFETLSMKTRYKQYLDPIVEETKRFCTALRRTAKDERVLFYYNGYGVPKPTPGGEIWVFNKAYTQYIPVTLYDLQAWLGNPCIFVWDASAAGNVVVNFKKLADRRAEEEAKAGGGGRDRDKEQSETHFPLRESIHLAACAPDEILPMNPELPADLFTCCLTSPIEISLRWFVLQNPLPSKLNVDMVMNIPGRLQDRRTPLGELNWIFTAITDTIAWTVLPRAIFRRLFRDDLMVAALLRNFLLAERIMRFYHCTPMSHPQLPATHNHPLWSSWDLAVDQCLAQLPTLLEKEKAQRIADEGGPPMDLKLAAFEYRHSTFFSEQLKAFEVWLGQGGVSRQGRRRRVDAFRGIRDDLVDAAGDGLNDEDSTRHVLDPPDQLPIVLQVLLSQVHRLRALILLSQFLDLGPRAVNLALSIGIFPYVLKLLQSPAVDLKPVLIYIWARILAVDRSCQNDLLRDNGFIYFVGVLSPFQQPQAGGQGGQGGQTSLPIPNVSEHRAMCAFILSVFCQDFPAGQQACLQQTDAMDSCLEHLEDDDFLLRQWSALCLAQLWDGSDEGKALGIKKDAHGKLCYMLGDVSPEVRAAVLYALGTLLGASGSSVDPFDPVSSMGTTAASSSSSNRPGGSGGPRQRCLGTGSALHLEESAQRSLELGIAIAMLSARGDSSPMVRKEVVVALSAVVREYKGFFVLAAYLYFDAEEREVRRGKKQPTANGPDSAKGGSSMRGLDVVEEGVGEEETGDDPTLSRVLSKLALEEGLTEEDIGNVPAFSTLFASLLDLAADSHVEVASMAKTVVDYILALLLESDVARSGESAVNRFAGLSLGAHDASLNRIVLPTVVSNGDNDGYFAFAPPSPTAYGMPSASEGLVSPHGTTFGDVDASGSSGSNGASNRQLPYQPKRAPSFAQTVKTIATLGYSRPSSPIPSPDPGSPAEGGPTAGNGTPEREDSRRGSVFDVRVADALAALISVDLQRFRNRASLAADPSLGSSSAGSTPMTSPNNGRSAMKVLLTDPGLGNDDIRDTLPLKSRLFSWCSEYYREPQMKPAEAEEPGSVKYNVQTWKRQRNERILSDSQAQAEPASKNAWSKPVSTMRNGAPPYQMVMHQFENHLVTASERDVVSVWDWEKARLLSRFHNGNPLGTNITSTLFINEEADGLLLVGSAEGDVRIYRDYDRPTWIPDTRGPELISSFRALPDLVRSHFPSGLVADWQQVTGHLLAGGDSRVIRVWDAHRELCVCDIPTRVSSCVTSISSEADIGHIFVAGFGDGTVGVYDRRNPPEASLVRLWTEHRTWVHKVHLQKHSNRELVSASDDSEVRLWDIRGRSSISKANLGGQLRGKLSSFAVHERAQVFAAASTPRQTRNGPSTWNGSTPQTIHHASFTEPSKPLGGSAPIQHHQGSHSHSHAHAHAHQQHHHAHSQLAQGGARGQQSALLPPAMLDQPLSCFTPAMASIAFHPHWPLMAYSGPDLAGTIEVKKFGGVGTAGAGAGAGDSEARGNGHGSGSAGRSDTASWGDGYTVVEGMTALPSYESRSSTFREGGEREGSGKRRSFLGI